MSVQPHGMYGSRTLTDAACLLSNNYMLVQTAGDTERLQQHALVLLATLNSTLQTARRCFLHCFPSLRALA